jgi:hypothetical protein
MDSPGSELCTAHGNDADHGKSNEGSGLAGVPLVVSRGALVTADPSQSPFDDPTLWHDDEAMKL